MAGNIKGITIQFRGETTELDEALRKINKETREIDKELGQVNRGLKFNPTSVELWRQKQQLLSKKIVETTEKLDVLRDTQKKFDAGEIQLSRDEFNQLKREIITTESKLKNFEAQLRQIGNANLKALSEQFKEIGSKMTSLGKTMTTRVTAPIVAGYTAAAKYASDYEENLNKLDVAFGKNSASVKQWAKTAGTQFGLSKVQATDAASAFGALGKGIGLTDAEAAKMSTSLAGLSADLGSYFNVGVDESAKALEGIFTGESEALKKFGVVMLDTNLKQFAADQNLVWNEMSQAEKTALRYQYVLEKTKDAQGDFSRTSDGTANSLKIFRASVQDLGTSIGTALLPIITPVIQKITELVNKFNELSPRTQKIITIVGLVVAAIGPLLVVVGTLISSIGAIAGAIGLISPLMIGIAAAIAAVVLAGITLYKNWDKIKAYAIKLKTDLVKLWNSIKTSITSAVNTVKTKVTSAWNSIRAKTSSAWNSIKNAITKPFTSAREKIKSVIDKIKSYFPFKIGKVMSGLKLPHFSLTGKFSLKDMTVPKLSVNWYKTGGIFDSPSVIGVGEAGSEAVVPLDKFWKKLDQMQGGININMTVNASNGQSAKEIADEAVRLIIQETKRRRLAWQ